MAAEAGGACSTVSSYLVDQKELGQGPGITFRGPSLETRVCQLRPSVPKFPQPHKIVPIVGSKGSNRWACGMHFTFNP